MKLSVVIAVKDRREELLECLRALAGQTLPRGEFETIVVDNGSASPLPGETAAHVDRLLELTVGNRCRARNAGVEAARAPWIAFTDSDCAPRPGWLAALAVALEREAAPDLFAVAGMATPAAPRNTIEAYIAARGWIDQEKFLAGDGPLHPPFAATLNLAVDRARYLELGGLDESLTAAGEDADLCWRAAGRGWRVAYAPAAVVEHRHRADLGAMLRQAYHYGVGNAHLHAKWHRAWGRAGWAFEGRRYAWALKGLLKAPFALALAREPLERATPWLDFLANAAQATGRIRGGIQRGKAIL